MKRIIAVTISALFILITASACQSSGSGSSESSSVSVTEIMNQLKGDWTIDGGSTQVSFYYDNDVAKYSLKGQGASADRYATVDSVYENQKNVYSVTVTFSSGEDSSDMSASSDASSSSVSSDASVSSDVSGSSDASVSSDASESKQTEVIQVDVSGIADKKIKVKLPGDNDFFTYTLNEDASSGSENSAPDTLESIWSKIEGNWLASDSQNFAVFLKENNKEEMQVGVRQSEYARTGEITSFAVNSDGTYTINVSFPEVPANELHGKLDAVQTSYDIDFGAPNDGKLSIRVTGQSYSEYSYTVSLFQD